MAAYAIERGLRAVNHKIASDGWENKARAEKIQRIPRKRKEVEIMEMETYPKHIHLLVSIPPKVNRSKFMRYKEKVP